MKQGPRALEEMLFKFSLLTPLRVIFALHPLEGEQWELGFDLGQLSPLIARILTYALS